MFFGAGCPSLEAAPQCCWDSGGIEGWRMRRSESLIEQPIHAPGQRSERARRLWGKTRCAAKNFRARSLPCDAQWARGRQSLECRASQVWCAIWLSVGGEQFASRPIGESSSSQLIRSASLHRENEYLQTWIQEQHFCLIRACESFAKIFWVDNLTCADHVVVNQNVDME